MKVSFILSTLFIALIVTHCTSPPRIDDMYSYAESRKDDLRLSSYITAQAVERLLSTDAGRREAVSILRANGITKVFVEVYRSGLAVSPELLSSVTEYFQQNGIEVVGGIATVPGKDFGIRQEARYGWFNWQNEKTQNDLRKVMVDIAPIFDTFIVDDFLCTADTSLESKAAMGERSWSQYRRDLLTELSSSLFIDPVKAINPDIKMIIKYPQWYDRFHLFGYDVARQTALYDQVWVGTETRSMNTPRFGFVQPYEGFVNYRWLASVSGDKIGGSWFDHIECTANDFYDQAWQSVLAGSKELTLFNYFNFVNGHEGHHLLRMNFDKLADLAKVIDESPVVGVCGYKPPNSDAGGDLYIMDFIGMWGVSLVPVSQYPADAKVIFLPTQAATDPDIFDKINKSLEKGTRLILTTGFLANDPHGKALTRMAGLVWPLEVSPMKAQSILVDGESYELELDLDLEALIQVYDADVLLEAMINGQKVPYLCRNKEGNIYVLNTHSYNQADFDAVGEVLLCPRPLGMLDVPEVWVNILRGVFNDPLKVKMDAPTRVSLQALENGDFVVHNYNEEGVDVRIEIEEAGEYVNVLDDKSIAFEGNSVVFNMPGRSRIWLRKTVQ